MDLDSGDFGTIQYSLAQTTKFTVDPNSGVVSLITAFNRTADSKYNSFRVIATDNPKGPQSNTASATVQV